MKLGRFGCTDPFASLWKGVEIPKPVLRVASKLERVPKRDVFKASKNIPNKAQQFVAKVRKVGI